MALPSHAREMALSFTGVLISLSIEPRSSLFLDSRPVSIQTRLGSRTTNVVNLGQLAELAVQAGRAMRMASTCKFPTARLANSSPCHFLPSSTLSLISICHMIPGFDYVFYRGYDYIQVSTIADGKACLISGLVGSRNSCFCRLVALSLLCVRYVFTFAPCLPDVFVLHAFVPTGCSSDLDLVFLLDGSGSVTEAGFDQAKSTSHWTCLYSLIASNGS